MTKVVWGVIPLKGPEGEMYMNAVLAWLLNEINVKMH
jgi:hypothetical protein